jgi:hypothetical protein
MARLVCGALLAVVTLTAASCVRVAPRFDLRSLGFGSSGHPLCVMPALRVHNPSELFDDSSLTRLALERLEGLFDARGRCEADRPARVEVWVRALPVENAVQVTVGVRGVGEHEVVLWEREFVQLGQAATRAQAREALNGALDEVRRFVTLDALAGRLVSLPEARLRDQVGAWFATRGVPLELEREHVLHSAALPVAIAPDGARWVAEGEAATVRVYLTPIDEHQTMLEVFLIDARGAEVRERKSEATLFELFDTELAKAALGDAPPDVEALADFSSDLTPAEVRVDEETLRSVEHACDVRLAAVTDFAPGQVVLLPDLEGSVETAQVVQRTLCAALALGRAVTLALDVDTREQASLNTFLASTGDAQAVTALLKSPFWVRLWQDGRSSRALLQLLKAVRGLRAQGKAVTVLAIDAPVPGNPRMARMATRLLAHHEAAPERLIVGYVSNTVARLAVGAEWDTGLLPLGYRLLAAGLKVSAFDLRYNSGTRWTCRLFAQGHLKCGTWEVSPTIDAIDADLVHGKTIFRHAEGGDQLFTGSVCVGTVTPSPPAVDGFLDEARPWLNRK